MRAWCEALGQETFVGTSGRVFPKAMKASPLLRAWLRRLQGAGVTFAMRHRFIGWQDGALVFVRPDGTTVIDRPDATVLALGGASWPRLGSDGGWVAALADAGVTVAPLRPANCGFLAPWSEPFRARRAGAPLKRIAVTFAGRTVRGEAVITADGLEGGAIYALSAPLREAIALGAKPSSPSTCVPMLRRRTSPLTSPAGARRSCFRPRCARPPSFHPLRSISCARLRCTTAFGSATCRRRTSPA